jgi:hypothetical protein
MNSRVEKIRIILDGYQAGDRVRVTNAEKSALWDVYQGQVVTLVKPVHFREGQRCWEISALALNGTGVGGFWCQEDCMEPE